MCTPRSTSRFKIVLWAVSTALVQMFWNFQDEILERMPTECIFRIFFHFNDLRSGQFSTRPIKTLKGYYRITLLPITFEPMVLDEWTWHWSVCLVAPNRMMLNWWPALTWPDLLNWWTSPHMCLMLCILPKRVTQYRLALVRLRKCAIVFSGSVECGRIRNLLFLCILIWLA